VIVEGAAKSPFRSFYRAPPRIVLELVVCAMARLSSQLDRRSEPRLVCRPALAGARHGGILGFHRLFGLFAARQIAPTTAADNSKVIGILISVIRLGVEASSQLRRSTRGSALGSTIQELCRVETKTFQDASKRRGFVESGKLVLVLERLDRGSAPTRGFFMWERTYVPRAFGLQGWTFVRAV
jgi:hypothetical protein